MDLDVNSLSGQRDPFSLEQSADVRELMQHFAFDKMGEHNEPFLNSSTRPEATITQSKPTTEEEPLKSINKREEVLDAVCRQLSLDLQQQFDTKVSDRRLQQFFSKIKQDTLLCAEKACELFNVSILTFILKYFFLLILTILFSLSSSTRSTQTTASTIMSSIATN
jgi:hypothetical protein